MAMQNPRQTTSFRALIYDMYSRDASKKVKTAKQRLAKRGVNINPVAPFGYMKDPSDRHKLVPDPRTAVGEVLGHTLAGIGVSLGLSMNIEAVTARYVDVRLERKKEVLDAYHDAVEKADPPKAKEAEPKKAKGKAKKKSTDLEL